MNKRRAQRPPRGQALVEFAAVIGVLIMLLYGITTTALALYNYSATATAAQAGAREAAIQGGNAPQVNQAIHDAFLGLMVTGAYTYSVTPAEAHVLDPITVRVTYLVPVRVVFWEFLLPEVTAVRNSEIDADW